MKIKYLYPLIFSILFVACDSKSNQAQEITSENINTSINSENIYKLTTTKGKEISFELNKGLLFSKQFEGKMVLINFWAPWCKPCVKEMPAFVEIQKKYKDDLIIIGVLFDKKVTAEKVNEFMTKYNVNFPITMGDENHRLAKNLEDVRMIPESFLYTKEGVFLEKFVGEVNQTKLENYIKSNK